MEPRGTKEELSKVKDLLGTATTDYSSSAEGRKHNVAKGASFLNGTIMYQGIFYLFMVRFHHFL